MRNQDQKSALTKVVRKYADESLLVKIINWDQGTYHYHIIVTPGSDCVVINCSELGLVNRAVISLFSDWVVRSGAYDFFIKQFIPEEKPDAGKE